MQLWRRCDPLAGFPKRREIGAWISFDIANQSFTLLVNTLLFSIFFSVVVVRDDRIDDRVWALTYGSSMLLAALASPWLGAVADLRARRKWFLVGSGILCGLLTCALGLIRPGQLWLAVLLYVPANFLFAIGENFLASFLPGLAKPSQVGRLSGFSWACAYAAALLILVITAWVMSAFGLGDPSEWRPFFVIAGLWFLVFTVPTLIFLREPAVPSVGVGADAAVSGMRRMLDSLRNTGRHRDLAWLLASSVFFGTGMSVVVFFASKLAAEFGFSQVSLVVFVGVITVSGVIGTVLPALLQDRIGHRLTVTLLLLLWLGTTLGFAWYAQLHVLRAEAGTLDGFPLWPMWLIGNLLGFGLGSLGSANRAFVAYLTPQGHEAEVFGLWGFVWKISAVTTFPFAWVKDTAGTPQALLLLAACLALGLVSTCFINERRGARQAGRMSDAEPR
jgi:UMF1 family MFS transporter